jgi:histidine phosphotransfer protein HptB
MKPKIAGDCRRLARLVASLVKADPAAWSRVVWGRAAMIDWKRVAELQTEIGTDGFAEVAEMFLEEADETVLTLTSGPAPDEVEGLLHFLKGSALNLGLSDLAALCQEGERKAAAGQGAAVDTAAVAALYRASRQALLDGLAAGPVATETAA